MNHALSMSRESVQHFMVSCAPYLSSMIFAYFRHFQVHHRQSINIHLSITPSRLQGLCWTVVEGLGLRFAAVLATSTLYDELRHEFLGGW